MSKLANVYADSLFEIALEENISDEILSQTQQLLQLFKENREFLKLLDAPMISKDDKIKIIDETFGTSLNGYLLNYLKVITQRKNVTELSQSFAEYEKLYNKHNNIEKVVATTAIPLSEEMSKKLADKLVAVTGKKILLTNRVDENCIGGVVLELSDTQIDDSIANKLENLKAQLKGIN